ncbi:MAG: UV DNA damage repair endonuclease UvsE [Actinomycetota bacterium]|nr:UV DNA damage repair endonuclease UvsE [Actinomycetota bacterium]
MRLGFAVKVLGHGGLPSHDARRWQSGPHLQVSLQYLEAILGYLDENDIRMYRMATALAPYASHPELPQFHRQVEECAGQLERVGSLARTLAIRLSSHPGQYTVLNSEDDGVVANAVAEIEVQAALMDAMGLARESVVVLHVGGAAGGPGAGADRFMRGFERLSPAARARLVIENDDRVYGVGAVHALARTAGIPVVFDLLHHHCHDPDRIDDRGALELALSTWRGAIPKVHFSSPRLDLAERRKKVGRRVERTVVFPELRAHADLIDPMAFEAFLRETSTGLGDFDVMLEAKGKDLALLRLRDQLGTRGVTGGLAPAAVG